MLYERELHDRLLQDVLAASPYADGYTLTNVLAREEAARCSAGLRMRRRSRLRRSHRRRQSG